MTRTLHHSLAALTLGLAGSLALATPADTLVMQVHSGTGSLEPAQAVVTYDVLPVMQMYEGLVQDTFGTISPLLASRYEQSADGKTTTFTLRRNVKFHDGSAMTCADAEYSLRRTLLVGNETSQAAQVRANVLAIPGFTPEVKKTFTFAKLAQMVRCNAAGQLVLTLDRNVPSLLVFLADAYIVPMKSLAAAGDWSGTARDFEAFMGKDVSNSVLAQKPNGTGAYQFVARDQSRLVFRAFPNYWGAVPKLKNIVIQKVDSDTARVLALQKGDADIAVVPDRDTLAKLKGVSGVKVYESLPMRDLAPVLIFNQNVKDTALLPAGQLAENNMPVNLLTDVHVRKGIAAAFDRATYTRDALKGQGIAMNNTLPPNSWADDKTLRPPAFNLKTAEAEFKQAWGGKLWSTGFTIPILVVSGQGISEVIAGILKQNLEEINPKFHVDIRPVELSAGNAALFQGKFTAIPLTWGGADPDTVLRGLYSNQGILASAVNISDPKIEAMLNEARDTVGQTARKPLYRNLLTYLNGQTYAIPLAVPLAFAATTSSLKGYENFYKSNLFRHLSK